jgi:hypothetical protein
VSAFLCVVLSCVGRGLASGRSPVQGVLPNVQIGGPFERYVDWRQCTTVMQREVVAVMPSCSSGGNIVVA